MITVFRPNRTARRPPTPQAVHDGRFGLARTGKIARRSRRIVSVIVTALPGAGPGVPRTATAATWATSLSNLGIWLSALGRPAEAEETTREAEQLSQDSGRVG